MKSTRSPTTIRPSRRPTTFKPTVSKGYQPAVCARGPLVIQSNDNFAKQDVCFIFKTQTNKWRFLFSEFSTLTPLQEIGLIGTIIRAAFHDSAEFDQNADDTLGTDGCLSISEDNAGLLEPDVPLFTDIEKWWQEIACTMMSRADFWNLLGNIVVREQKKTEDSYNSIFDYGRPDNLECQQGSSGRLPSAQGGLEILQQTFVDRMGLTMEDAGKISLIIIIYDEYY